MSHQWTWHFTALLFFVRITADLLTKSATIFNFALSDFLNVGVNDFAMVVISYFFGNLLAVYVGHWNEKFFSNSITTVKFYSIFGGILTLLFSFAFLINTNKWHISAISILIYLCFLWLLFGISASILGVGTINIVTENTSASKHNKLIAILNVSWTCASALYIITGFLIDYHPALFYILMAVLLITISFAGLTILEKQISKSENDSNALTVELTSVDEDENDNKRFHESEDMEMKVLTQQDETIINQLKYDIYRLVMICSFFISIASGSMDVIVNPVFIDVFGLSVSESGIYSLSIFVGELMASICLTKFSDKLSNNFRFAMIGISCKIITGSLVFVACRYYNQLTLGSFLPIVVISYFGWECYFVTQIIVLVKYCQTDSMPESVLLLKYNASTVIGGEVGIMVSTYLWFVSLCFVCVSVFVAKIYLCIYHVHRQHVDIGHDHYPTLTAVSLMWIGVGTVAALLYFVVFYKIFALVKILPSKDVDDE